MTVRNNALDKAYRQHQLWPQIHAAADVFLKRKAARAEPYELTWRLIHLWESVVVTLAEAASARLMTIEGREQDVQVIREKCYGRTWNEGEGTLQRGVGALDGSVDRWIEILDYVASIEPGDSPFLGSLVAFLTSGASGAGPALPAEDNPPIDVAPLVDAWRRACEVPAGLKAGPVPVKAAFKIVNSFRNRFAHVPFPYDVIQNVFTSLEACTLQLFSAPPSPVSKGGTLAGAIAHTERVIKGATVIGHAACPSADGPHFLFDLQKTCAGETWLATPFVHVDEMFRPYVLTRMKDDAGLWEFTRYLAESNAVVTISDPKVLERFPIPSEDEYETQDQPEGTTTTPKEGGTRERATKETEPVAALEIHSIADASSAIRQRKFQSAITFLEQLVEKQPEYHVGWLKLGVARRELAVDSRLTPGVLPDKDTDEAVDVESLLRASLEALDHAKEHIQRSYKAEAYYQASKTSYRLWRHTRTGESLDSALQDAQKASDTYPDSKYESWIEYLLKAQASVGQGAG